MDDRHVELRIEGDSIVEVCSPVNAQHKLEPELKRKYFGDGQWVIEPDLAEFTHEGIDCKIRRVCALEGCYGEHMFGGHFCGYCRIPEGHTLYENVKDYLEFDVHGGITFNEILDDGHWIGFDCGHSFDIVPSMQKIENNSQFKELFPIPEDWPKPSYKNFDFVIGETKSLAQQVIDYV